MRRCEELGLIERCRRLQSRRCTREELKLCHDEKLLDLLESTVAMDVDHLKEVSSKFDCLYIHQESWDAALLSAGGAIDLVTAVVNHEIDNGMAIVRPPGHHAGYLGGYGGYGGYRHFGKREAEAEADAGHLRGFYGGVGGYRGYLGGYGGYGGYRHFGKREAEADAGHLRGFYGGFGGYRGYLGG